MNTATDQWLWYRVTRRCKLPYASTTWWMWQAEVEELLWSLGAWRSSAHDVHCRCNVNRLGLYVDKDGNITDGPNLYA